MDQTKIYERNWIKIVAVSIGVMGLVNIISAWFSYDSSRFKIIRTIFDYHMIMGSRYLVVLTGIIALLIAPNLYKQKKIAWFISVFILAISGIAHIVKGADIEEASLCILLLGILLPLYRDCNVKSDPIRVQRGGKILIGSVIFIFLYTFIGLHFFAEKLGLHYDLSLWKTGLDSLLFDVSSLHPQSRAARFFTNSILIVNSFSVFIGTILALSPVIIRSLPEINYWKYLELANKCAKQPIQIFTLSNDYMHFGAEDNLGNYLSYKLIDGVAMAIGNPCGNEPLENFIGNWLEFSHERDWIPAFYQAQEEFVEVLKTKGFQSIPIGVEALVDLDTFSLEGKSMQELRSARNKAEKEDWIIRKFLPSDWEKVRLLDRKWLKNHGSKEIGFAMGKSSQKYLNETRTMLLFDKDENLLAYLNNIELSGNNSRAVDLMRRDPEFSTKGTMEALFLNEILTAKEEGKKYYDLGLSPLAEMDKSLADNKIAFDLLNLIYKKQSRYYDFQGLHRFKSKFSPIWQQSFLMYPNSVVLPKILLAIIALNKSA